MLPVSWNIRLKRTRWICLYILFLSMPCIALAQDDENGEVIVDTTLSETPDEDQTITTIAEDAGYQQEKTIPVTPELRKVPDSAVNRMKREEAFAYANDPEYWTKKKQAEQKEDADDSDSGFWYHFYRFFANSTVRTIMYTILGVIFVLIIYRVIVVNNLYMTGASRRRKEEATPEEREIDDENLDQKIQAAIQEGNYRSAIRFMYIKSLRSLHEKGWIRYHAQTTNNEYISQVHPYGIGNEFRFLTHVYEYVWYGEFALSEDQFNRVQQNFQQFFNAVKP